MRDSAIRARLSGLYGIAGPVRATDPMRAAMETLSIGRALLAAGVPVLQLRHKSADGRELLELARVLKSECVSKGALFLVNDRVDVALAAGADGVHLGQSDLPVTAARALAASFRNDHARNSPSSRFVVGLSTHDVSQVRAALAEDVDYLGFGPVFGTTTKRNPDATTGLEALSEAVRSAGERPVVAIGGITIDLAHRVKSAGAAMAAVISDVANAADPESHARVLHGVLSGRAD